MSVIEKSLLILTLFATGAVAVGSALAIAISTRAIAGGVGTAAIFVAFSVAIIKCRPK